MSAYYLIKGIWDGIVGFFFGNEPEIQPDDVSPIAESGDGKTEKIEGGILQWAQDAASTISSTVTGLLNTIAADIKLIWDTVIGYFFGNDTGIEPDEPNPEAGKGDDKTQTVENGIKQC